MKIMDRVRPSNEEFLLLLTLLVAYPGLMSFAILFLNQCPHGKRKNKNLFHFEGLRLDSPEIHFLVSSIFLMGIISVL
jgi:hypothetical protein